jgi:hypothetical protein
MYWRLYRRVGPCGVLKHTFGPFDTVRTSFAQCKQYNWRGSSCGHDGPPFGSVPNLFDRGSKLWIEPLVGSVHRANVTAQSSH